MPRQAAPGAPSVQHLTVRIVNPCQPRGIPKTRSPGSCWHRPATLQRWWAARLWQARALLPQHHPWSTAVLAVSWQEVHRVPRQGVRGVLGTLRQKVALPRQAWRTQRRWSRRQPAAAQAGLACVRRAAAQAQAGLPPALLPARQAAAHILVRQAAARVRAGPAASHTPAKRAPAQTQTRAAPAQLQGGSM